MIVVDFVRMDVTTSWHEALVELLLESPEAEGFFVCNLLKDAGGNVAAITVSNSSLGI